MQPKLCLNIQFSCIQRKANGVHLQRCFVCMVLILQRWLCVSTTFYVNVKLRWWWSYHLIDTLLLYELPPGSCRRFSVWFSLMKSPTPFCANFSGTSLWSNIWYIGDAVHHSTFLLLEISKASGILKLCFPPISGIVASNTRDNSIGATYPHLNFSIPITVLQPALLEYTCSGDLRGFQALDRVADRVRIVWRLQREPGEVPLSKL